MSEPGGTRALSRMTTRWAGKAEDLVGWLEKRRFTGFLLRSYRWFDQIEGKHLALVIGTNLFVALIPLMIIGYAFIGRFNPHHTVGAVLVDTFHLTGGTAIIVKNTFSSAKVGRNVALSISVISLLVTGFDISATVQLAYARAFKMTPLKGAAKFARGGAWLVLLLATMGISLTLKYTVATRPPWVLIVAVPAWHDLATGAAICTVAVVAVNALASFELHRWFSEYGAAYGGFGVGLALMAAVALIATFWVWIAAVMGIYWERKAGSAVVARMEELSAERARSQRAQS